MSALDDLTEKQRAFVLAYAGECLGNGTAAARAAGYLGSENALAVAASKALSLAKVQAALRELTAKTRKQAAKKTAQGIADATEVQLFLTRTMKGQGDDQLHDKAIEPKDKLKAAELLAKVHGLLVDRKQHSIGRDLAEMPDAQLLAILDEDDDEEEGET